MAAKKTTPEKEEMSFEEAIGKLEAIVEQMESNQLPLEDLMVRYEEGTKLVQLCSARLDAAEKRIEIITRNAQGGIQLEPFEPDQKSGLEKNTDSGDPGVSLF